MPAERRNPDDPLAVIECIANALVVMTANVARADGEFARAIVEAARGELEVTAVRPLGDYDRLMVLSLFDTLEDTVAKYAQD